MNDRNVIHYQGGGAVGKTAKFFFTGSTAVKKGQLLCYDADRGTAANVDGKRGHYVELPHQSNNRNVAGAAIQDYAAVTGGQEVECWIPGGMAEISVLEGTTINATLLTGMLVASTGVAGASGRFIAQDGFYGRGSAVALQTVTALTDTTTSPGVIGSSVDGSATWTAATRTLTKTSAFTYAAAGDKIIIVAGVTTSGSTTVITKGEYTIESVTSANAVVLTTSAGSTDSSVCFYHVRGNPTCLCYLLDGEESGLLEWITPYTDGSGTTAVAATVGGRTLIFGGITLGTGDSVDTLADGTYVGQKKSYRLMGALTTNDHVVSLATTGEQLDGTTDLGSLEFDGADDDSLLIWGGQYWRLLVNKGTGLA